MIKIKLDNNAREDVFNRLNDMPDLIAVKQKDLLDTSNHVSMFDEAMKTESIMIMHAIANETYMFDDIKSGEKITKKKFTNDSARQAEQVARLRTNKEYNEAKSKWEHNKKILAEGQIKLGCLKDRFSAAKYMARLLGSVDD